MSERREVEVLVAEDDGAMRDLIAASLSDAGFAVELVDDGGALRERIGAGAAAARALPQVIVSDLRMPGWTGLQALRFLQRHHPTVHVVLITAFGDPATHVRARKLGAAAVFDKPFELATLRDKLLALVA